MKSRYLALAALLAPTLPVQAQTGMEAFNPMTMLAPIMTPLGAMLVPMLTPMNNSMNQFNPAAMSNPMAMMPNMQMPGMPQKESCLQRDWNTTHNVVHHLAIH